MISKIRVPQSAGEFLGSMPLKNQRGSAVLYALGLVVLVTLGTAASVNSYINSRSMTRTSEAIMTQSSLISQLKRYAAMGATYRSSLTPSLAASANLALANCILGSASTGKPLAAPVNNCLAGIVHPVTLYFPLITANPILLAGPGPYTQSTAPARFDLQGNVCPRNALSVMCPFEVYSTFTATCPAAAAACDRASQITVTFEVRNLPLNTLAVASSTTPVGTTITSTFSETPVLMSALLPPVVGTGGANVVETIITANTAPTLADLLSLLKTNGITNPALIAEFKTVAGWGAGKYIPLLLQTGAALAAAGITNENVALQFISARVTSAAKMQAWNTLFTQAGVTNGSIMGGLIIAGAQNVPLTTSVNAAIVSAIKAASITDTAVIGALAWALVADPVQAAQTGAALQAARKINSSYFSNGNVNAAIVGAGITNVQADLAIGFLGIEDQKQMAQIQSLIVAAGSITQTQANKIASTYLASLDAGKSTGAGSTTTTASTSSGAGGKTTATTTTTTGSSGASTATTTTTTTATTTTSSGSGSGAAVSTGTLIQTCTGALCGTGALL